MLRIVVIVAVFCFLFPIIFKIVNKKVKRLLEWQNSDDVKEIYQDLKIKNSFLSETLQEQEEENKKQALKIKSVKEKLQNEK